MKLRKKSSTLVVAAAAAALVGAFAMGASQARAQSGPVFDWSVTGAGNPNGPGGNNTAAGYTPAPFVTDASAAAVRAYLSAQPAGSVLAIKVNGPISATTANIVFGTPLPGGGGLPAPSYSINYIFADFENGNANQQVAETQALIAQVRAAGSTSANAFVGQFNLSASAVDGTRPPNGANGAPGGNYASSFQTALGGSDYKNSGVNMSNESAYPGSGDFESAHQAGAPNIRSALFVLPIDRVTFASVAGAGHAYLSSSDVGGGAVITPGSFQNIPWISRFNNWGNTNLNNVPGFNGYKYAFDTNPTLPGGAPNPNVSQLLSSADFSAQVLQYRLRGATSFNLFNYAGVFPDPTFGNSTNSSVIGYSQSQEQVDAQTGWNFTDSTLAGIFSRNSYAFANLVNKVPGSKAGAGISSVASGMMLSGVYDSSAVTGGRHMALLLSNLSAKTNTLVFSQKIGGAAIDFIPGTGKLDQTDMIAPGSHELLDFALGGTAKAPVWELTNGGTPDGKGTIYGQAVFVSSDTDRQGVGVPEPTSLGLLALAGLGLLSRRRRMI